MNLRKQADVHQIHMGNLTEQLRAQADKSRRAFIASEAETVLALARSAESLHLTGSTESAKKLASKAWEAYASATNHLKEIPGGKLKQSLIAKLDQIRAILETLSPSTEYKSERRLRLIKYKRQSRNR